MIFKPAKTQTQHVKQNYQSYCQKQGLKPSKLGLAMYKAQVKAIGKIKRKEARGRGNQVSQTDISDAGVPFAKKLRHERAIKKTADAIIKDMKK